MTHTVTGINSEHAPRCTGELLSSRCLSTDLHPLSDQRIGVTMPAAGVARSAYRLRLRWVEILDEAVITHARRVICARDPYRGGMAQTSRGLGDAARAPARCSPAVFRGTGAPRSRREETR